MTRSLKSDGLLILNNGKARFRRNTVSIESGPEAKQLSAIGRVPKLARMKSEGPVCSRKLPVRIFALYFSPLTHKRRATFIELTARRYRNSANISHK
jgi:hypothetical protein